MKIAITQGKFVLVDRCDEWLIKQFKWHARFDGYNWYAGAFPRGCGNRSQHIVMHRLLAGFPPFHLDHQNGNGLDNRRRNLRPASGTQNQGNTKKRCDNSSGFKGVYKRGKKWIAQIGTKPRKHLGVFDTAFAAHQVYRRAAKQYFGEFVRV
jgi:hypothetical protein